MPTVLSIQSAVAYGHVGNSAAVFPLQRLGVDVWPVNTVLLSNHPGHGACRGHGESPEAVNDILQGIEERAVFDSVDAMLTGYLSEPALGPLVMQTLGRIKAANPSAIYACDPVMGDHGGFFVAEGLPEFFADVALPQADILTPNTFELSYLSGMPTKTITTTLAAARALVAKGPGIVMVTSVESPDYVGQIGMILVTATEAWAVFTPKLDIRLNGTGDCLTALTLGHTLLGLPLKELLARVASTMFGLVEATYNAHSRELRLVSNQDEIIVPSQMFKAFAL